MNSLQFQEWQQANQKYLAASLDTIRNSLEKYAAGKESISSPKLKTDQCEWNLPSPPALEALCTAFSLSPFERGLLLLCAGVELQPEIATLCASAQNDSRRTYPTFALAMQVLPEAHWSALSPSSPLRRWHMIKVGTGAGELLTKSLLQIDERLLHYLVGVYCLDERLQGFVEPVLSLLGLPSSYRTLAGKIACLGAKINGALIQLCGNEYDGKRAIALSACEKLGLQLHAIRTADIPAGVAEREALARLWERESFLSQSALLVDCEDLEGTESRNVLSFLESLRGFVMVACRDPLPCKSRLSIRLDVEKPSSKEQQDLWRNVLASAPERLDGHLETIVGQFDLGLLGIERAGAEVLSALSEGGDEPGDLDKKRSLDQLLWEACRSEARPRLSELAQHIDPRSGWDDLVLPLPQKRILREIAAQVKQRSRVYNEWGFASKGSRGLGISALFTGGSGTGKTMAAEVLANELSLDLYRIDLSQVVSKYIGETEKNIRRVFDAAEEGGAILLFDEADALFGKRSEVKDSHDRYANIEISYLLQRMETYRGLAILTTNMKKALDTAFMRRIRFIVDFPFPDASQRAEIWSRIFPQQTPLGEIDVGRLARLNVAGGSIRNIALYAAFLAADAKEKVDMKHLLRAAQVEYAKLERPLAESEVGGWT